MNTGGRPRKTKEEKEASGTLQKCREVDHPLTFNALVRVPSPPEYLEGYAVEFFTYYAGVLLSVKMLTASDMLELEGASIAYGEMRNAYDEIKRSGSIQTTSTGYKQKSAAWTVFSDARKILGEFSNKYGLNVVSRQRIDIKPPEEPDDLDKI